jgi:hypothetical protein
MLRFGNFVFFGLPCGDPYKILNLSKNLLNLYGFGIYPPNFCRLGHHKRDSMVRLTRVILTSR